MSSLINKPAPDNYQTMIYSIVLLIIILYVHKSIKHEQEKPNISKLVAP